MTGAKELLAQALLDEPRDDVDLIAVMAEGRRRRQRRRRWVMGAVVAGAAAAVVATTLGPRLFDDPAEPDPAPPSPKVVPVDVLPVDGANALPTGVLRTHHVAVDFEGVNWDRWAGVTDDGYVLRIRNVYETDTTRFGLVDPATGRTEWLPDAGYDFGDPDPVRLTRDELVFLDSRRGSGAVAVYDRVAGRWASYATFDAFNDDDRMYQLDPITTASVDAEDRLWIKLFEAPSEMTRECSSEELLDLTCQERWWSVPFRDGGRAERVHEYDGSSLVWEDETGLSVSAEGLTIMTPDGRATAPLAVPDGCELRDGYPPMAYSVSPVVVGVPCVEGMAVVVHDDDGAPLFALEDSSLAVAGDGYVGVVTGAGQGARLLLVHVDSQRVYTVAAGSHTVFTDIGEGLVLWQSPEQGWAEKAGSDYWVAELP